MEGKGKYIWNKSENIKVKVIEKKRRRSQTKMIKQK